MRPLVATIVAVAFLANASLAQAVEGANGTFDGVCPQTDSQLALFGRLVDDIERTSFEQSRLLPRDERPNVRDARVAPKHVGPRAFHEPSGFDAALTFSWDYSPRVTDDAKTTTVVPAGEASASTLAAHGLWGMGKQVVVLHVQAAADTVRTTMTPAVALDAATQEIDGWKADPLAYYKSTLPGFSVTRLAAPGTATIYRQIAATVPAKWQEFLEAPDTKQAEMVGAAVATIGVTAATGAKGKGTLYGRPPVSLGANARTAARLQAIKVNADAPIIKIDPAKLRWSQTTAGGRNRVEPLRESIDKHGYHADEIIDVVQTKDGLVTIDNTRPAVALEKGIREISARVHQLDDPLPPGMTDYSPEMIARGDKPRFGLSQTWGDALAYRTAKQSPFLFPEGTTTPPKLKP